VIKSGKSGHFKNKTFASMNEVLFLEYKVNFKPRYENGVPPHPELYSIINAERNNYRDLLNKALISVQVSYILKMLYVFSIKPQPKPGNVASVPIIIITSCLVISSFKLI
jgi:hypothetical protein